MISTERATEIARSIVDARIYINVWGDPTTIDNNLMGGIELAHVVASSYVSQLTISGERRLVEAHKRITALREAILTKPMPVAELVTIDDTNGVHHALYIHEADQDARPVLVGEILTDSQGDTFQIDSAKVREADGVLIMAGHWRTLLNRPTPDSGHDWIRPGGYLWPNLAFVSENA